MHKVFQARNPDRERLWGRSPVNGDPVPNATVALEAPKGGDRPTLVTQENGFFQFSDVKRGTPYQININAKGFAESSQTSACPLRVILRRLPQR